MPEMNEEVISRNFIENEIDKDLQEGVYDKVVTRFPPEPNVICILDMPNRFC